MAGMARHGAAWQGMAGRGEAWQARRGLARRGEAGHGEARHGRRGEARLGPARHGEAWQEWRGLAGQPANPKGVTESSGDTRCNAGTPHDPNPIGAQHKPPNTQGTQERSQKMADNEKLITLTRIERQAITVTIAGVSPLIPHRWSEKAKGMMRDKQTGSKARAKKEAKDPAAEAEASLYRLPDGRPGMPATAFKAATVGAARLYDGITMTALKTALFIEGEGDEQLVPIEGDMKLREDTPRNATGVADLRYRYQFYPWTATLTVVYVPSMIDDTSVINLIDAGGNGGVGDWRPSAPKSHTGTYGRYEVQI